MIRYFDAIGARRRGVNWAGYWASQPEVLFFGLYSEIADGKMPNKVNGATDYLTVAGSAGSETYQCPNTAPYIAADVDKIWFSIYDGSQRLVTTTELISYDLAGTPVKYTDDTPNAIVAIMILSSAISGIKKDRMFSDFWLPILWDNSINAYGHIKSNRLSYAPLMEEIITAVDDREFNSDTGFWTRTEAGDGSILIANGVGKYINVPRYATFRRLNICTVGEKYYVKYRVSNLLAGTLRVSIGAGYGEIRSTDGDYTDIIESISNGSINIFQWSSVLGTLNIDNISFKHIPY